MKNNQKSFIFLKSKCHIITKINKLIPYTKKCTLKHNITKKINDTFYTLVSQLKRCKIYITQVSTNKTIVDKLFLTKYIFQICKVIRIKHLTLVPNAKYSLYFAFDCLIPNIKKGYVTIYWLQQILHILYTTSCTMQHTPNSHTLSSMTYIMQINYFNL